MKETSFTELRNQAKYYFDLVESDETVRVLRNGRPIAEIRPSARDLPSWKAAPRPPVADRRRGHRQAAARRAWPLMPAMSVFFDTSALDRSVDIFGSDDVRQCSAARGSGLQVAELR